MASTTELEEARIRAVYAARRTDARYSWLRPDYVFFMQERERDVLATLKEQGLLSLKHVSILEIGCGTGYWLREFIKWGARPEKIAGIDLLPDRVAEAKKLAPQNVRILCGSANNLPVRDESFELVLQSTMFTSILDETMKQRAAAEMLRVTKASGLILWYDFCVDNPRNRSVRGIRKREILRLFPRCEIEFRRVTLAPPLLRFVAPYSWLACYTLSQIPWLRTHYLCAIRRQ